MDKQTQAIIDTSLDFLEEFNCNFSSIEDPEEALGKYFELIDDWDGLVYVHIKASEGEFSHWYILDMNLTDIESIVKWLKKYTENVLRFQFKINV